MYIPRLAASTLSVNVYKTNAQTTTVHRAARLCQHQRLYSSDKINGTKTTDTLDSIKTPDNLSDFRAREEQREQEAESAATDENSNEHKIDTVRSEILNAALPFVSIHGWTREAIAKGAESQGYPGVAHGMFPNGGVELIQYFYLRCNEELIKQLKLEIKSKEAGNQQPTVEFISHALRMRLQMIEPYLAHWPQALGIMSLPQNVPTSLAQLLTLIDDICYYAGDRSVDVSLPLIIVELWSINSFFSF